MTHPSNLAHARRLVTVAAVLAAAIGLAGCGTTTPVYDQHFGLAVRTVRAMQTLNPDAASTENPGINVNGRAATAAMDRYNDSYRTPQSDSNAYTVGLGAASSLNNMGR